MSVSFKMSMFLHLGEIRLVASFLLFVALVLEKKEEKKTCFSI